jgi:hypothetical protein
MANLNKIILKEEFFLSDRAVFILREMKRNRGWMNYSSDYDYLHRERFVGYANSKSEEFGFIRKSNGGSSMLYDYSMSEAWGEVCKHGLVYHSNRSSEGCYIKYSITEKGYMILKLTNSVKTFKYNSLRSK